LRAPQPSGCVGCYLHRWAFLAAVNLKLVGVRNAAAPAATGNFSMFVMKSAAVVGRNNSLPSREPENSTRKRARVRCGCQEWIGVPGRNGRQNEVSQTRTPLNVNPAAGSSGTGCSALDGVGALAVLALGGCEGRSHPLADRAGQETPKGMPLPAGRRSKSGR